MKKYMLLISMALSISVASFAQDKARHIRKDEKKQDKMEKKSTEMETASRNGNGKKSLKELNRMEKKENKLDKKAEK